MIGTASTTEAMAGTEERREYAPLRLIQQRIAILRPNMIAAASARLHQENQEGDLWLRYEGNDVMSVDGDINLGKLVDAITAELVK